jgi:hypothetical protein
MKTVNRKIGVGVERKGIKVYKMETSDCKDTQQLR